MATLDSLKWALHQAANIIGSPSKHRHLLSDAQYSSGSDILIKSSEQKTYQGFIIAQLIQLMSSRYTSHTDISVLEIGPGPKSILSGVPIELRRKIRTHTAFEPNNIFAARLETSFRSAEEEEEEILLPCLKDQPDIHRKPFAMENSEHNDLEHKYDIVIFCYSMYGMKPKRRFVERALDMLVETPQDGIVVVFHREGLQLDGLVCHRTAVFPTGVVRVADDDMSLDCFASFTAGFVIRTQESDVDEAVRIEWRKTCRALGQREKAYPCHLNFSAPEVMLAFNQHATKLPELLAQIPSTDGDRRVKSWEARLHRPTSIIRPKEVKHVQQCVRWARKNRFPLTVIGGSHGGHCLWPNVVAVDMGAFNQIHILTTIEGEETSGRNSSHLAVVEAGCNTGDIVRKTMAAGLAVPLGSRPSVGIGLSLQGGIGHLARTHGLACDSIVGFVMVSVDTSEVFCVGDVPRQYRPAGAIRPDNEDDLLWAVKGAGTNFGIVTSVIFKAYTAPTYLTRNWLGALSDSHDAQLKLGTFDRMVAKKVPRNCSADAYLFWDAGQLHFGMTVFDSSTTGRTSVAPTPVDEDWGPELGSKTVDCVSLFESDMYVSGMHGGHGGGKTSSFKRCLFLKDIGEPNIAKRLVAAVESRPSPFSYLHLLHGSGAVSDVATDSTAFGCRGWNFACVITGVWPRDQDGTETARSAV
jgi:hypothetical protein